MKNISRRYYGQALPEMVIVFPLVVILIMAILQIALIYRGKATVNNATFMAARSGALNHGYLAPMEKTFLDRMSALGQIKPILKTSLTTGGLYKNPSELNFMATSRAMNQSHGYATIEVIWPTKAIFNHFAIPFKALKSCTDNCPFEDFGGAFKLSDQAVYQIPLENQDARKQSLQSIAGVKTDLQDANLLSIQSRYCYVLEVPVANAIIWRTLQVAQGADSDWQRCQSQSDDFGKSAYLIPIRGHSIVRMQSGFRCEGDERNGRNCKNI